MKNLIYGEFISDKYINRMPKKTDIDNLMENMKDLLFVSKQIENEYKKKNMIIEDNLAETKKYISAMNKTN